MMPLPKGVRWHALKFSLLLIILALPVHAHAWRVQPVSSQQKLTAKAKGILEPFAATPAQLRAARGEWESFQVVVAAGTEPLKNVRLQATPLATHLGDFIPASNIQLYRENYVFVDQPSGNRQLEKLWWPDALIPTKLQPSVDIAANRSEVLWVTVHAPRDAESGEYYGAIDITANGAAKQLFVSLTVDPVTLPKPTLRANVAVYYGVLRDWYLKNLEHPFDEHLQKQYYEFLLDYRINAYDLPVAWDDPQAAKYLQDDRVLSVRLPPLSETEKLQSALRVLRQNRALHKNYYYWIDEPSPQRYKEVRETTAKLHAIDTLIKHCVTVHPNQSLQNAVDIWCPNIGDFFGIGHLDLNLLAAERRQGRETWWYTMVEPKYPYPTWLLDDDAMSVRMYGALMARYGINGFVYSMAHGWGPKPLQNLQSFAGTNGDGTLVYPSELVGGVGPMPSIRLMLLRDAIEDYELIRAGLRKPIQLREGLLREKITPAAIFIPPCTGEACFLQLGAALDLERAKQASPLQYRVAHNGKTLFVKFLAEAKSFERDWCAIEIAPREATERFRFVVTPKGNSAVERHTREGQFRLENFDWKSAVKTFSTHYEVEMQIPLSVVNNQKTFRLNALRRIGGTSTPRIVRAYPDAGDVTLMPLAATPLALSRNGF